MAEEIWTIGKILKWTEEYFAKAGLDTPRLDAEVLLCYVLQKERIHLYVHFDQPLSKEELAQFKGILRNGFSISQWLISLAIRILWGWSLK